MAKYVWQPLLLLAFLTASLTLFYWRATSNILWAVGASSLASSAYIVFAKPSCVAAHPRNMITAYVIAIFVGIFFRFVVERWLMHCFNAFAFEGLCWAGFLGAFSVLASLLLMIPLRAEHPPAAGVALVLVLDVQNYQTLIIILFSVIMLSLLNLGCRRWMEDLF